MPKTGIRDINRRHSVVVPPVTIRTSGRHPIWSAATPGTRAEPRQARGNGGCRTSIVHVFQGPMPPSRLERRNPQARARQTSDASTAGG